MVTNLKVLKAELATACLACQSFICLSLKFLSMFIHNMHMQITRNKTKLLTLSLSSSSLCKWDTNRSTLNIPVAYSQAELSLQARDNSQLCPQNMSYLKGMK